MRERPKVQKWSSFHSQDYGIRVYWNKYTIDGRFRKFRKLKEDVISRLVTKYDEQRNEPTENFYDKNFTERILMAGNSALIAQWDAVREEVSEVLLDSCAVYSFIDDYLQTYYG